MGTLFVSNQAYEWTHLATRWYTNSYGSVFFITTGIHGLHVFLGLVAMVVPALSHARHRRRPG